MSRVVWTVLARRKLEQSLLPRRADGKELATIMSKQDIETRLRQSFTGSSVTIIIQDVYVGFRRKADRCILLVEVDDSENPGPRVVKLGPPKVLRDELAAWQRCRPYGLRQDLVLMSLVPCFWRKRLTSLIYGDAKQSIGVDETCALEDAVSNAALHGTPTVLSVRFALIQLFERLGQLLHVYSTDDERNQSAKGPHLEFPRLWESLQQWGAVFRTYEQQYANPQIAPRGEALRIRLRPGNSDRPEFDFRDPVDYLARFVKPLTTWRVLRREKEQVKNTNARSMVDLQSDPTAQLPDRSSPSADRYIPRFRRGRVHGDLHGRNIQVGIADDQALWPSVFDFEDMTLEGLIGLDFVKLETELKIRVLPRVLNPRSRFELVDSLYYQEFEYSLNVWSESTLTSESWPRLEDLAGPRPPGSHGAVPASVPKETAKQLSRLRTILLEIRRLAAVALGKGSGRPAEWLREYLFLQMCYGVTTVRFKNLTEPELTCAFIAAGSAAGWLSTH